MIVHNVKIGNQESKQVSDREHKKIYVGCAESDIRYRDLLVYGRHRWELYSKPTIDFLTLDRKEMELVQYKPIVEKTIQRANGVMILISAQTSKDSLALWEIDCSLSNKIPIVGVDIRQNSESDIPTKLAEKMTRYGWEWFAEFFNGL
ncbi:MAG: TIR domain-containing protein [Proteobacteria bacterium]|nr:TIR domain-containing protein [Pseudomonadota bacterium]MBU1138053.1 TIR domain-containing protein [Pseudomonadota bacterium]MBU1233636.1 TIR domain-containing protein [Pseudomonadota bacterium]MBU1420343.1 TIR domain-containing protein [Pseudomonadota bacterium]MBU1454353.1 TIR domain-containing protein [Pseudomonadota bacterium]